MLTSIISRECCLPLLSHCLDSEQIQNDTNNGRLLKLLLRATLNSAKATAATAVEQVKTNTKSPKKTSRGRKGKDKTDASTADAIATSASMALTIFESVEAEKLMHRALRTPGQAQTLALRVLSSAAIKTSSGEGGAGASTVAGEDPVRQRRDLVLALVEVGLAGADGSLVAAVARALPARPCDLAAILSGLVPASPETATSTLYKVNNTTFWVECGTFYSVLLYVWCCGVFSVCLATWTQTLGCKQEETSVDPRDPSRP